MYHVGIISCLRKIWKDLNGELRSCWFEAEKVTDQPNREITNRLVHRNKLRKLRHGSSFAEND
jgi:hypothetical protein